MNRKRFIKNSLSGLLFIGATPQLLNSQALTDPEQIDENIVKEFVTAGHSNLPKVKEMLSEYPNLIYSSYDWGNSDFEEAIEGASHLGNKEIANYLISKGARVNLFTLAMLGKTDLVISTLEVYPNLIHAKGAHGFTLLHHANVGKVNKLSEYLKGKGLIETHIDIK